MDTARWMETLGTNFQYAARRLRRRVTAGLIGSAILTRFLQDDALRRERHSPLTFGALTALLAVVALAACLIPAQRATRVDPLAALRHE